MELFKEMLGVSLLLATFPVAFLITVWFELRSSKKKDAAKEADYIERKRLEQIKFNDRMNYRLAQKAEEKAAYADSILDQQSASRAANKARADRKLAKGLTMLSNK